MPETATEGAVIVFGACGEEPDYVRASIQRANRITSILWSQDHTSCLRSSHSLCKRHHFGKIELEQGTATQVPTICSIPVCITQNAGQKKYRRSPV